MFKYSYCNLVYLDEAIDTSIERIARCGYDGIELAGEPDANNNRDVRRLLSDHGIKASSICSLFTSERDLTHPDKSHRDRAVDYVKRLADMAAEVGAPVIIAAPAAVLKTAALSASEDERKWAVEGIREGAEYASTLGIKLCLEAWNRYETYWLNRLDQCAELMREINLPNVRIMADTFHMNIEEQSIEDAIRLHSGHIIHVHFADSNRAAPGAGHIDFLPILQALKDVNYQEYITFEILPAASDSLGVIRNGGGREFFEPYTKHCIDHIKSLEKLLK